VVIISIDTLRADRLPAYGYAPTATPAIDDLVDEAVLFETTFSHAPTTTPAHTSLFTAMTPAQHGVRDNLGYSLADDAVTMAERFADLSYRTAGFVSAYPLRRDTGLSQGFTTWDDAFDPAADGAGLGEIQRAGAATVAAASAWLQGQNDGRFLLFVHLFEPHLPYTAPEPFASAYDSPYDAEVAYADALVGDLLATLTATGLYDEATVVLLADHGEGLGDHGEDDHGIFVYPSTLRVPLVIKLPNGARGGERVDMATQLADVAPTLLALVGAAPLPGAIGRDLFDANVESTTIYAETYQPPLHFGWSELITAIDYPYQYIQAPEPELYDLSADPGALTNLIAAQPEVAAELRGWLAASETPLAAPQAIDVATRDRLAALGYVTTGQSADGGSLPDPKNRIGLLRDLKRATSRFFASDYVTAIAEFEVVLQQEPTMPVAWEWLARSQQGAGQASDALESFEMLRTLGGGGTGVDLSIAELGLQLGRYPAAAAAANRLLITHPVDARTVLARVALAEGRAENAAQLARRALSDDDNALAAHLILAEALVSIGELQQALDHAGRAAVDPTLRAPALVLSGRVLMVGGNPEAARQALDQALNADPTFLSAHIFMAATYFATGGVDPGLAALQEMVRINPTVAAERRAIETLDRFGLSAAADEWRASAQARHPDAAAELGRR